jgi:hypothetical protein
MITDITIQEISLKVQVLSSARLPTQEETQPLRCSRQTVLEIPSVFSDTEHVGTYRYGLPYKISICVKNAYKGREGEYIPDEGSCRHGSSTWKMVSHIGKPTERAQVQENRVARERLDEREIK